MTGTSRTGGPVLTPEQVELVEALFARIRGDDEFPKRFYAELFERDPSTRALFSDDLTAQRQRLLEELDALGEALRDLDRLRARTVRLGRRHHEYGVRPEHYAAGREAMEAAMAAVAGDAFDEPTRKAWRSAYDLIATAMQEGAAS